MFTGDAFENVGEMVALLKEQRTLFCRLRALTQRQRSLITQDDSDALLGVLSQRQQLVDGLIGISDRLAPYRSDWSTLYAELEEPVRQEVAGLLEETNAALHGILQSDRQDTAMLTARKQQIADSAATLDHGSRAGAAYGETARASAPCLTDATA